MPSCSDWPLLHSAARRPRRKQQARRAGRGLCGWGIASFVFSRSIFRFRANMPREGRAAKPDRRSSGSGGEQRGLWSCRWGTRAPSVRAGGDAAPGGIKREASPSPHPPWRGPSPLLSRRRFHVLTAPFVGHRRRQSTVHRTRPVPADRTTLFKLGFRTRYSRRFAQPLISRRPRRPSEALSRRGEQPPVAHSVGAAEVSKLGCPNELPLQSGRA